MAGTIDYVKKHYSPQLRKCLESALTQRIATEFPHIGGKRVVQLCTEMLLEVIDAHQYRQETVGHGQVLWQAIAVDDPPQRLRATEPKPVTVVLDLCTTADIAARIARQSSRAIMSQRAVRLCEQAYEQGAVLSNVDLASLLSCTDGYIGTLLAAHERATQCPVPRRGTVHDVGTALTHKSIICRQHYLEGKEPVEICRATHHSLEAVDRYLSTYARVQACRRHDLSVDETASLLRCSIRLVRAYRILQDELHAMRGPQDVQ